MMENVNNHVSGVLFFFSEHRPNSQYVDMIKYFISYATRDPFRQSKILDRTHVSNNRRNKSSYQIV